MRSKSAKMAFSLGKTLCLIGLLISCKKEEIKPSAKTHSYETVTYIAYGTHNWYELEYMDKGTNKILPGATALKNFSYTYSDTVGGHKRIYYKSSTESDTMTAIIKINGITKDSITVIGANQAIILNN